MIHRLPEPPDPAREGARQPIRARVERKALEARTPTVVASLLSRASREPGRTALICGGAALSYGDLGHRVRGAAEELRRRGVGPGDRVVLSATSGTPFVVGYLATHLVRASAVPLDPEMPAARREEIVRRTRPRAVFEARGGPAVDGVGVSALGELDGLDPRGEDFEGPGPDDVADILFTTGTGGRPKGVVLTHGNISAAAAQTNAVIGNGPEDREVVPLPLSHSFGLGRLRCNLVAGGMVIPTPGFRLPGEIFAALAKWEATGLVGVPAGMAVLLRVGEEQLRRHAHRIRYVEIGSAPMSPELRRRLMDVLSTTRIWMHYGLTEASRSAFVEFHADADRLDAIGRPAPGIEIRVADPSGRDVPDGTPGEFLVRGPTVMRGYLDDPERTAAVLRDGWLHTGDTGRRGVGGLLYFEGRDDDMINTGGYKVAPLEVESAIDACPGVGASACVGAPDPQRILGQVVHAYLEPAPGAASRPTDEQLVEHLRGRVERYKIPVAWHWLPSLPRTASGKLQRAALRERTQGGEGGHGG